jgi:hypothetical protein
MFDPVPKSAAGSATSWLAVRRLDEAKMYGFVSTMRAMAVVMVAITFKPPKTPMILTDSPMSRCWSFWPRMAHTSPYL